MGRVFQLPEELAEWKYHRSLRRRRNELVLKLLPDLADNDIPALPMVALEVRLAQRVAELTHCSLRDFLDATEIGQHELIEMAVAKLEVPAAVEWSRARPAAAYCKILAVDGHAISESTFHRMLADRRLRGHPDNKRGAYRIDLRDLPPGTD